MALLSWRVKPRRKDFAAWARHIPRDGDLLFLRKEEAALLPPGVRMHAKSSALRKKLWTLDRRSWYGYALNGREYFAWLPAGQLEKLNPTELLALAKCQEAAGVPTLLPAEACPG